jgi:hypothetical protein
MYVEDSFIILTGGYVPTTMPVPTYHGTYLHTIPVSESFKKLWCHHRDPPKPWEWVEKMMYVIMMSSSWTTVLRVVSESSYSSADTERVSKCRKISRMPQISSEGRKISRNAEEISEDYHRMTSKLVRVQSFQSSRVCTKTCTTRTLTRSLLPPKDSLSSKWR